MIWHIFYTSDKKIAWSTSAGVDDRIKTEQSDAGKSYVQVEQDDLPIQENFYVNSAGDGITAKTVFDPTFSTLTPAVDAVVNVTGVPAGTEVLLDGVSKGTMSDTTLTLTASQPGSYTVELHKLEHITYATKIVTAKQS
jgi:hypothetical protein|tara:strand:- start:612 stop:1028 length:417 start_codon:yes stop_codon:yes gene_type:complete